MSFHHDVLPNGLQVIAELNDRVHSVATGFFVKTGSRDESTDTAGISHFLEHMVFKGTDKRDALAVNRDLDRIGAKHNAQTSEEDTIYHVTCLGEYLSEAFAILSDILRPSLREEDFQTEKQVILEEIHMYQDNPMMVAYEAAKALHYKAHPLSRSVLGTVESVTALDVTQMRKYYQSRYAASNIVLAFAGNASWPHLLELAKRHCSSWETVDCARTLDAPGVSGEFQALLRKEDLQQTVIAVSPAPSLESPLRYAAALLATIIGDHTGSRLFWELIEPGHADGVELSYQEYNEAGAFYTFLSCDPSLCQDNIERIHDLYRDLLARGITATELEQAKNKVLSRSVLRSERPMGRLMPLGFHWSYRREYLSVEQEIEAFSGVTPKDVQEVIHNWPILPMTLVSVGPTVDIQPPATENGTSL